MSAPKRDRLRAVLSLPRWWTVNELCEVLDCSEAAARTLLRSVARSSLIICEHRWSAKYQPKEYRIWPPAVNIAAVVEKRKPRAA